MNWQKGVFKFMLFMLLTLLKKLCRVDWSRAQRRDMFGYVQTMVILVCLFFFLNNQIFDCSS